MKDNDKKIKLLVISDLMKKMTGEDFDKKFGKPKEDEFNKSESMGDKRLANVDTGSQEDEDDLVDLNGYEEGSTDHEADETMHGTQPSYDEKHDDEDDLPSIFRK